MSENDWLEVYIEMQKAAVRKMEEKGLNVRMMLYTPAELCALEKERKKELLKKADYIFFLREGQERF